MYNPLNIEAPYDKLQFINNLQAYNSNRGTDEMLDLIREIQQSGNYYFQGYSIPTGNNITIPGNGTVNGTMQVPTGAYVTSISSYCSVDAGGFKIKLWDKGSKASIFYGDYALQRIVSGDELGTSIYSNLPSDAGVNPDIPFGPGYLMSPFIVNDPGVLGWELVNLSAVSALIQVLLCLAIPINAQSVGQKIVSKEY
jgi:hypothetical protein